MSSIHNEDYLNTIKTINDNIDELKSSFTILKNVNITFIILIKKLQKNDIIFNLINKVFNTNNNLSLKKKNSKISLNLQTTTNKNNLSNYFTLSNFYINKKKNKKFKQAKSRNNSNFQNFIQTTFNNKSTKKNNTLLIKRINNTLNNNKYKKYDKKIKKLFSLKISDNKTNKNTNLDKRNNFRDLVCFTRNEKSIIYKNYFSVDNKNRVNKKQKIKNKSNNKNKTSYHLSLNNNFNKSEKNICLVKKINNYKYKNNNKQKPQKLLVPNKNILFLEINKYRNTINKLKTSIIINKRKIHNIKEENKKIKLYLENKNRHSSKNIHNTNHNNLILLKIKQEINKNTNININNNNSCHILLNNTISNDISEQILKIKNEYDDKNLIDDIINSTKKFYLEYNYSFSSNEIKKIIYNNDISFKNLYDLLKNASKLILYEHMKNKLYQNKYILREYKAFIINLFNFFEVDSIQGLIYILNRLINNIYK